MASGKDNSWASMLEWTYTGVDHSLTGNGGIDCINFIPTKQKIVETIIFVSIGLFEITIAIPNLRLGTPTHKVHNADPLGKRILLLIMTLTFGIELGYKFATRQMIWILNPCHLVTMMQIFLLAAPPSKVSTAVFRLQIHGLSGAIIALLFPVVNTRLLPFETEVYYIQHVMMLVIPYYLMRQGGVYTPEPLSNYSWCLLMLGMLFVYHWILLQGLAIVSLVNLNNMVCPAVSDPFHGPWYRVCAATHQTAVILLHGKTYTFICQRFIPAHQKVDPANSVGGEERRGEEVTSNGHYKPH